MLSWSSKFRTIATVSSVVVNARVVFFSMLQLAVFVFVLIALCRITKSIVTVTFLGIRYEEIMLSL